MTTLAPRRRPAWYLIAVAEARMLARNKIALLTATVTPLALSGSCWRSPPAVRPMPAPPCWLAPSW